MNRHSNYDKFPTIRISEDIRACRSGWTEIVDELKSRLPVHGRFVVAAECYPGVDCEEIRAGLQALHAGALFHAEAALKSEAEITALLDPWLGDDPVFGMMRPWELKDFFDSAKTAQMRREIARTGGVVLVYGTGAAYVAEHWQLLLHCDVTRWEIQQRQRSHRSASLGGSNASDSALALYKRGYFVDWRAADTEKHRLHGGLDYYMDTNLAGRPSMISGEDYRASLAHAATRPFRVVPFFDPGVWGGEWMRHHCDLPPEPPNFAWCFDCVPEENSLRFGFGDRVVETPALSLVHEQSKKLLGQEIIERFGAEFPIRFDFLDTVEGGNLSLQVHPLKTYIKEHFGMSYTQDESYYILDAMPDAVVYLGLQKGVCPEQLALDLKSAQDGGAPFPAEEYVNAYPVKKHDHVLIPAGTVHCSGKNSMVLEISATPYIFTFKLWDWDRVGLDGKPRPIHIEHGLANIQWNRDRAWVDGNLVNRFQIVARGEGWCEERTGLHELEFIETRRHWFTQPVPHETQGNLNVLNLVEGDEAVVESPSGDFAPFVVHYAETFIIPACVGPYRIAPTQKTDRPLATLKAYVRTEKASHGYTKSGAGETSCQ
ncbi:MAG: class I mannose-6-phosphate isomerase [Terracidiphilus sp.]